MAKAAARVLREDQVKGEGRVRPAFTTQAEARKAARGAPMPGHGGSGPRSVYRRQGSDGKTEVAAGYAPSPTEPTAAVEGSGTSVFDPLLCELVYRWFCPPGGLVLDPFAGGSVRGLVAAMTGRRYLGIELRRAQLEANLVQVLEVAKAQAEAVAYLEGDARELTTLVRQVEAEPADLLFTCPPYFDLEIYSDDPRDLSAMGWEAFLEAYRAIIAQGAALLKPDRFAVYVVSDVREPKTGYYRALPARTIEAFESAGLRLWNEAVLVQPVGSLPLRFAEAWQQSRKLGRTHQNVLVFVKGDARAATAAIGEVEFGALEPEPE